jgi:hypothetical protein
MNIKILGKINLSEIFEFSIIRIDFISQSNCLCKIQLDALKDRIKLRDFLSGFAVKYCAVEMDFFSSLYCVQLSEFFRLVFLSNDLLLYRGNRFFDWIFFWKVSLNFARKVPGDSISFFTVKIRCLRHAINRPKFWGKPDVSGQILTPHQGSKFFFKYRNIESSKSSKKAQKSNSHPLPVGPKIPHSRRCH